MKNYNYDSWVIISLLLISPVNCAVIKRRLCIEYKKENYLINSDSITTINANTEHKCMVSCVRRYPCMAFNYHAVKKTCILMAEIGCLPPHSFNDSSYLFAHLQPCKVQPVWYSVRPPDRGWYWVTTDDPNKNSDLIQLPGPKTRYVTRTLYKGYYLPGWWLPNGFRVTDPVTPEKTKCTYGEFLAFSESSSYWWSPYTAGDALPACALAVSELPDGTPLYIVKYQEPDIMFTGFYNHFTKSTLFAYYGVISPTAVDILCGTGIWNTTFYVSLLRGYADVDLKQLLCHWHKLKQDCIALWREATSIFPKQTKLYDQCPTTSSLLWNEIKRTVQARH